MTLSQKYIKVWFEYCRIFDQSIMVIPHHFVNIFCWDFTFYLSRRFQSPRMQPRIPGDPKNQWGHFDGHCSLNQARDSGRARPHLGTSGWWLRIGDSPHKKGPFVNNFWLENAIMNDKWRYISYLNMGKMTIAMWFIQKFGFESGKRHLWHEDAPPRLEKLDIFRCHHQGAWPLNATSLLPVSTPQWWMASFYVAACYFPKVDQLICGFFSHLSDLFFLQKKRRMDKVVSPKPTKHIYIYMYMHIYI